MSNFYDDNEDIKFYIERGIDWEPLVGLTEYDWQAKEGFENCGEAVEFYGDLLQMVGSFVANEIDPYTAELDRCEPKLVDGEVVLPERQEQIFEQIKELELHGMTLPRELGGMNCPLLLFQIATEVFARADVSVTAHHGFHGGIAMAMLAYSIDEGTTTFDTENAEISSTRFADEITEIITGAEFGSMDITEPGAGSDMAAIRTKGEQDEDGNWLVTGQKIFITSGQGKYHFVIARTEPATSDDAFAGLAGLSMFLVPAYTTDEDGKRVRLTTIDGLEEKLGHHGSATVAISFDRTPAHLIGKRGDGFKHMLMLMNGARVGVGFESLGLCEAAYRLARDYAAERPSMGKTIDRHEMIADYLDEMRTDLQAIRALAVYGGYHEELAQKLKLKRDMWPPNSTEESEALARAVKSHQRKSRRVTPLLKYYASEKAVDMARQCIQIHGGCGYMQEYGAERLLRDAIVMPIYEGTSQIQSLMAMKDTLLGVVRNPQGFMRGTARARWKSVRARDPLVRRVAKLHTIENSAVQFLLSRLASHKIKELRGRPMGDWSQTLKDFDPKRDFAMAMLHAERLTKILIDVAIADVLLEQAQAHPERRELLERWLERTEARCRFNLDEITTTGLRLLATLNEGADADEEELRHAAK
jgi:hypothetical protein